MKRYLIDLGVPAKSLETVGYGENRPAEPGPDEDAWAQNRRVEFQPLSLSVELCAPMAVS